MISFLLGSGFSIDEGIPGLTDINKRFVNLKADEIYLGSDQTAAFLNEGAKDPNGWFPQNVLDRTFFVEFIEFYCKEVVGGYEHFNYEEFIDYFYLPDSEKKYPEKLLDFLLSFRKKHALSDKSGNNNTNLLFRFYNMFAQLLAGQLWNPQYFEDASYSGYTNYNAFISFLSRQLEQGTDIKVHTLNHDMFFDFLGSKQTSLWQHYCDGYESSNSSYYGALLTKIRGVSKTYHVKLKYFADKFDKKLCLYKLHGSIDTYVFNLDSSNTDHTRIKTDLGIQEFYKEIKNEADNTSQQIRGFQNKYPDFLSGTSYKQLFYGDSYYKKLHEHFTSNLNASDLLIVVGYGFKDKGVNEMLVNNFLTKKKRMIVIDPYPNTAFLQELSNIEIIAKGINLISHEEWDNINIKTENYE